MSAAEHHFSPLYPSTTTLPDHPAPWIGAGALLLRRRNPLAPPGTASKPRRKPRPSAKRPSPITYISADAANFREMVELATGLGIDPPAVEAAAMRRFSPSTLDTSASFLLRAAAASDFVPVFLTLESSGVM